MSSRRAVLVTAVVGTVFTVAALTVPLVPLAVRDPELHVAVEVTAAWVALTAAVLVSGRLRRRGRLPDLALVVAFGLSGSTNLVLSAVPAIVGGAAADTLATWGALAGRTMAAGAFAFAAFAPDRVLSRRSYGRLAAAGCAAVVGCIAVVFLGVAGTLPPGVGGLVDAPETRVAGAQITGHPLLAGAQVVMVLAYGLAAVGFARRADRDQDPLLTWLAAAAVLAAFARINFALLPSLYAQVVYSGDLLRVGFYVLLLGGVLAEMAKMSRAARAGAAAEERRRIARDLHDGLAQELAFIATQATWLARRRPEERRTALLASSAQRALDESRRAIETLAGTTSTSLPVAITQAVEEVAGRFQQRVELAVDESVDGSADLREQLVRIVREAVANAARHGEPEVVAVRLAGGDCLELEVIDDGCGFDQANGSGDGLRFGLQTMRERAEALGGTFALTSTPGHGTTVRVEVPWHR